MTWTIEFERVAAKEFRKLDQHTQRRIRNFLQQRILATNNPRSAGKPLRGPYSELWRYRIGTFRVVAAIQDQQMIVLVVRVSHRREVYK